MARKRMIDPNFWRDEKIGELTHTERLMFIGLWTFSDDNGVGRANPKLLKADIFPYDDTFRVSDFSKSLDRLATLNMITLYSVDNQEYYHITNFSKYQTINRPSPSSFPSPHGALSEPSMSTHGGLTAQIEVRREVEIEVKEKCEDERAKRFTPPPLEEVSDYCRERVNNIDPQYFIDFYTAKGWKVGSQPMKDWKAAIRTWERRDKANTAAAAKDAPRDYSGDEDFFSSGGGKKYGT